jgi:hypothetical protein
MLTNSLDTAGHGFSDRQLVRDFLGDKKLPVIHDPIGSLMALIPEEERRGLLDLGACTGLLMKRARLLGFAPVIGLEPKLTDNAVFSQHLADSQSEMFNMYVRPLEPTVLTFIASMMHAKGVTTVVARRVLPEILGGTHPSGDINKVAQVAADALGRMLINGGATRLIIEGRVPSPRAKHDLSTVDKEIEVLSANWDVLARHKACALLVPRLR